MANLFPLDFAAAHARVCTLCDRFDERIEEIKAPEYKEAVARVEFITPFFKALGWDVDNEQHRSIYEKDCVLEKAEQIDGTSRSADYAFRRPGTHLIAFYVEAKKPAVDIRNHADCHQAVSYGWNATIREVKALERRINDLVAELYGLTEEEVALVESATAAET